ncbi:hypothetical protein BDY24DRAFT_236329 [Mrakia frigida]|uniref:uncharacterized protein n=1 Tax=Mrakia frigida TaxID=29902 RepID=UPI003FCBFF4E
MEYLLEMGSSSSNSSDVVVEEPSSKRWTYLPFIETDFGGGGPLDVISLPDGNIDEDFSFDWDISFSSLSPLRIALAYKYIGRPGSDGDIVVPSSPEENHRNVLRQDAAEFLNALSGHSFDNDARPLLRFSLRRLSSLLTLASFIITAHYWWSRTTTVGISTVVQVLSSLRALGFVVLSARHGTYWSFHLFFFSILAELFVVSSLCGRIEWTWGGIGGWVPVGVSRRKATHSERASSRIDATFSWTMRALLFLLFFLFAVLSLPNLPHLISASPSSPPTVGPGSHRNKNGSPVRFLTPANQSFHLVLFLSQFLLNQRSRTFAGTHKIAAALDLVSELAWNLPIMLSSRWGTWLMMDPLTPWFLVVLGAKSALAYQAWSFETVKQEDGEEEEEESSR